MVIVDIGHTCFEISEMMENELCCLWIAGSLDLFIEDGLICDFILRVGDIVELHLVFGGDNGGRMLVDDALVFPNLGSHNLLL